MKNHMKKALAVLLTLIFCFGLMAGTGVTAIAAEDTDVGVANPAGSPDQTADTQNSGAGDASEPPAATPPQDSGTGTGDTSGAGANDDGSGQASANGDLELSVVDAVPYSQWKAATTLTANTAKGFTLSKYNSGWAADQLWFAVNVTNPNDAIKLDFAGIPAADQISAYLFSYTALNTSGPTWSNVLQSFAGFSGSQSFTYKVSAAGVYYVELNPYNSSSVFTSAGTTVTFSTVAADAKEPNDTWQTASVLTAAGGNVTFNLNGSNDADWFKVTTTAAGQSFKIYLSGMDYSYQRINATLYRGADLAAGNGNQLTYFNSFNVDRSISWHSAAPGDYYIRVYLASQTAYEAQPYKIRYELLPGDAGEVNDDFTTATPLTDSTPASFNLNGINDVDWFSFATTKPGEVLTFSLGNFNTDYSNRISYYVYDGASGTQGNYLAGKDATINDTLSVLFDTPGTHYMKIFMNTYNDPAPVENSLTLRFDRKIVTDDHEPNNTWQTATAISEDVPLLFNLPDKDTDWMKLHVDSPDMTLAINYSGFLNTSGSIYSTIYSGAALNTYGDSAAALNSENYYLGGYNTQYYKLTAPGDYYIRLTPSNPTTNILSLTYELIKPDKNENNDTWKNAAALSEGIYKPFTLPAPNDTDWFKITTTGHDQTIAFNLDGLINETGTMCTNETVYWALFRGADFVAAGDSASAVKSGACSRGDTLKTYYYAAADAGDYYLSISMPYAWFSYGYSPSIQHDLTVCYNIIPPDANEPNDTWQTATTLQEGVSAGYTLPASNDTDWFKITVKNPGETVKLDFGGLISDPAAKDGADDQLNYYLYSGDDLKTLGNSASSLFGDTLYPNAPLKTMYYKASAPGDFYVKVNLYYSKVTISHTLTVQYSILAPDRYENNDTWQTATAMQENVNKPFTLPAPNDTDWFKLTTDKDGQTIAITLDGLKNTSPIPNGNESIYWELYSGADFTISGNSAGSLCSGSADASGNAKGCYFKTLAAGDYYIKITMSTMYRGNPDSTYSHSIAHSLVVKYNLIDPDAHENNDTLQTASYLPQNALVNYTLNAVNDKDFFRLVDLKAGDTVNFYFGGISGQSDGQYAQVYYKNASGTTSYVAGQTIPNPNVVPVNAKMFSYTATTDGTYYIATSLSDYSRTSTSASTLTMHYTVARDNTPVTGVSLNETYLILNAGVSVGLLYQTAPYYASNQNVTWISANKSIATVAADGTVTSVALGKTTVTVTTADGGYKTSCTIEVVNPVAVTGVEILMKDTTGKKYNTTNKKLLPMNGSMTLPYAVYPATATNQKVTWASSDESVLAVTNYGKVYAVGSGSASITVKTADGGFTDTIWFRVPDDSNPVTNMSIDKSTAVIYMGENETALTASIFPSFATDKNMIWKVSDSSILTLTAAVASGNTQTVKLTPKTAGEAIVTVTSEEGGFAAQCSVTVLPVRTRVTGITFMEKTITVGLYGTVTLKPVFAPANATDQTVSWTSSHKDVAVISRYGVLTALSIGETVITAISSDGGFTASVTVKVTSNASLGDINNDGAVDAADALLVLRVSVGLLSLTQAQKDVADVNGDSTIDAADAILILRYDVGLINKFPASK